MLSATIALILFLLAILAWRDPRLGLFVVAASLPAYLVRLAPLTVPTTLLELMILVLTLVVLIRRGRALLSLPLDKGWRRAITLVLVAASAAVLVSADPASALGIWKAYFVEPVLLFWLAGMLLTDPEDRRRLLVALGIGSLAVSAFAAFQFLAGFPIPLPWDVERRVTSFFPYPNAVGLFQGPLVVIAALMAAWSAKAKRPRADVAFWLLTAAAGFGSLILAQSEGAIAAVVLTLFGAALCWRRSRQIAVPLALIAATIALVVPALRVPLVEKATLRDYSGSVRLVQWEEAVRFLKDAPLLGAGLNGYPAAIAPYHVREDIEIFQYPHNVVLNVWTELGLLGLAAFALLAARVAARVPSPRSQKVGRVPLRAWISFAAGLALLETCLHGLVDVPYFKNDLAALAWLLIALIFLTHVRPQAAPKAPGPSAKTEA